MSYLVRAVLRLVRLPRVAGRVARREVTERDAVVASAHLSVCIPAVVLKEVRRRFVDVCLCQPPRRIKLRVPVQQKRQRMSTLLHEIFQDVRAVRHELVTGVHGRVGDSDAEVEMVQVLTFSVIPVRSAAASCVGCGLVAENVERLDVGVKHTRHRKSGRVDYWRQGSEEIIGGDGGLR